MSAASQSTFDRWNMYKSRVDSAGSAVIRATQFLVRPKERFPTYRQEEIESLWEIWRGEEECFYHITRPYEPMSKRSFPKRPEMGAEQCCYGMWGLLIQVQIDGTHGSTEYLRQIAKEIGANEKCKAHPATCSCHVPENPWIYKEDVDAMEGIETSHNPKCHCGGYHRCAQREMLSAAAMRTPAEPVRQLIGAAEEELRAHPELKVAPCRCDAQYANILCWCLPGRIADAKKAAAPVVEKASSTYDYKHNVENCPCGTCHKARVDSGTADEYLARVRARSQALAKSAPGIGAACGGGANQPGFAEALFAAMGTPHDSKCPHGLPFYACMPCSH
jgi:hypothetical protein